MVWLLGWNRRKPKLVKGSTTGAQTSYQMKITIYKGIGTDTNNQIYLGGYANNDFSDIRFTSSDEISQLSYWIESYTFGVSAIVWIKIDSIPADPFTKTIYIYYDNPVALSQSNGPNTFVFYDDFESGNLDGWIQYYAGAPAVISSEWINAGETYSTKVNRPPLGNWGDSGIYTPTISITNLKLIADIKFTAKSAGGSLEVVFGTTGWSRIFALGTYLNFESGQITNAPPLNLSLRTGVSGQYDTATAYFDRVRVRKFISPEPTWGTTSPEQINTANLSISSIPTGAKIYINNIDYNIYTDTTVILNPGTYTILLTQPGYHDYTEIIVLSSNQNAIVQKNLILSGVPICSSTLKYEGDTVHLSATPKDGTSPYYVEFIKTIEGINTVISSFINAPENIEITDDYILTNDDIRTASSGTINFEVYMQDSCPTGSKTCTGTCTVNIGCIAPICNFNVT